MVAGKRSQMQYIRKAEGTDPRIRFEVAVDALS